MANRFLRLALIGLIALPGVAVAQTATTTDEAGNETTVTGSDLPGDLSLGQPTGTGVGETYVQEVVGDWAVQCVRAAEGEDPCQIYQLLKDQNDNPVAEISIFALPAGGQAAAGATVITPLETLLTQQISMSVDGSAAKRYPFSWCSRVGCFARIGFTETDLGAFRRGSAGTMAIVPVAAPDQKVELRVSLSGFTKAYGMLKPPAQPQSPVKN